MENTPSVNIFYAGRSHHDLVPTGLHGYINK